MNTGDRKSAGDPENKSETESTSIDAVAGARKGKCSMIKGVVVLVFISAVLGLATNTLRGKNSIDLSRNYFPSISAPTNPVVIQGPAEIQSGSDQDSGVSGNDSQTSVTPDIHPPDDGIQRLTFEDVRDHFMTAEEEYVSTGESIVAFVDARVRDQYEDGHIPGAVWLYHYESDSLVDDLRPQLELAFFIIVYCNGGDCEDSIHLAADLGSLYGMPPENIYVYEGGFNEWKDKGMPVVSGSEAR